MSTALALIRFNNGSIYIGCYETTTNMLEPWLTTLKELKKKFHNSLSEFQRYRHVKYVWKDESYTTEDDEDVEIFINYGQCFMWKGEASKTAMIITSDRTTEANIGYMQVYGRDFKLWVYEWMINNGFSGEFLSDKINDPKFRVPKYHVGEYLWLTKSAQQILYTSCMFKPEPLTKPIKMKIQQISFANDGCVYNLTSCPIREKELGVIAFGTYQEALEKMNGEG